MADVTMLVICYLFGWGPQNFCEPGADSEGWRGAYPWPWPLLRLCSFGWRSDVSDRKRSKDELYLLIQW